MRRLFLARKGVVRATRSLDAGILQCLGRSNAVQGNWNISKWDHIRYIKMYAFSDCIKPVATAMLFLWKALIKFQIMMT